MDVPAGVVPVGYQDLARLAGDVGIASKHINPLC